MDRARQTDPNARPAATSRRVSRARSKAGPVPNTPLLLSVVLAGEEPPSEFRLFTAGEVETSKGTFLFDEAAAKSVMAAYETQGNEMMVDYDHASVAGLSLDPATAGKAAGWFTLEVRNGELWAVNVRWTEPAADALRAKEWRYMSPAFFADKDGRITSVRNVAITNLPATRRLEPLMAASITALGDNAMTLEEFMKVCKALGLDMSMSLDDAMAKIKGESAEEEPKEAPADPVDPAPSEMAEKPAPEADKPEEVAAALSALQSLSGKASFVASVADIRTWHASHVTLSAEQKKLAEREAVLESAERRKLCIELVSLAGRAPAAVWADETATTPKPYLLSMPIADLRAMHGDEVKANSGKQPVRAPATKPSAITASSLTAAQLKICKETGCDPAVFATLTAQRDSVKSTAGV